MVIFAEYLATKMSKSPAALAHRVLIAEAHSVLVVASCDFPGEINKMCGTKM